MAWRSGVCQGSVGASARSMAGTSSPLVSTSMRSSSGKALRTRSSAVWAAWASAGSACWLAQRAPSSRASSSSGVNISGGSTKPGRIS